MDEKANRLKKLRRGIMKGYNHTVLPEGERATSDFSFMTIVIALGLVFVLVLLVMI
jgi:hypothetical protein